MHPLIAILQIVAHDTMRSKLDRAKQGHCLVERRGAAKSDNERLELIPEVVTVMREIREVEEQLGRGKGKQE